MIHSASIACADLLNIEKDVRELMAGGITFLHVDIMDGHDVPNFCMNLDHVKQLRTLSSELVIETHFMVTNPADFIDRTAAAGANYFTTHRSNIPDVNDYIRRVRASGMKAGLVLKLEDEIDSINDVIGDLDLVLVMSIVPGDYGRPFDVRAYDKVKALSELKRNKNLSFIIEVDGGVDYAIAKKLKEYGTDAAVAGVFTIFRQPEGIRASIERLNDYINK